MPQQTPKTIKEQIEEFEAKIARRRANLVTFVIALYFVPFILTLIFASDQWSNLLIMYAVYSAFGLQIVKPDEIGTITFLGKPTWQVRNGPAFVPPIFCGLRKDPGVQIKLRIGTPITTTKGDPVKVEDDHDSKYYVKSDPMRITFATSDSAHYEILGPNIEKIRNENSDPLSQRLTPDPNLLLIYKIDNHPRFLEEVGTVQATNELLLESGSSGLSIIAGQITPAMAIRHQDIVEKLITQRIEIRVGEYDHESAQKPSSNGQDAQARFIWLGIDFMTAQITSWGLPKAVNQAQAAARSEGFNAQAVKTKAEGEKEKRKLEGEGAAEAKKADLFAVADGTGRMIEKSGSPEGILMQHIQAMRDMMLHAKYSVVTGASNPLSPDGFIGIAAGIDEALTKLRAAKIGENRPTDSNNPPM